MTRTPMITEADLKRLHTEFLPDADERRADRDAVEAWLPELRHAHIIPLELAPPDLVTLDSHLELRDIHTNELQACTLVCSADHDGAEQAVSALTPAGIALLGSRVGDRVVWWADNALQMARVERLLYQPEAAERELLAALTTGSMQWEPFLDFDPVLTDGAPRDVMANA